MVAACGCTCTVSVADDKPAFAACGGGGGAAGIPANFPEGLPSAEAGPPCATTWSVALGAMREIEYAAEPLLGTELFRTALFCTVLPCTSLCCTLSVSILRSCTARSCAT